MDTNQIYSLVNTAAAEAMGTQPLAVLDAQSLISLGNTILSSNTNTEAFLNVMAQRIGRTIFAFREYNNKLRDMVLNDFEYGAILQKISFDVVDAETDPTYSLVDGESIDQYTVKKPKVDQKLFVTRTPYMFKMTTQRTTLREAFTGPDQMGAFIGYVFGTVRNFIELALESLGRTCIANMIAETAGSAREIKLLTNYNAMTGSETPLTAAAAWNDPDFLRYAVSTINLYSDYLTDMSKLYNDGSLYRHTPKADQRLRILSMFERKLETVVQYSAFHDEMVRLGSYFPMNFWQSAQSPEAIQIKRASDGQETSVNNVIAIMHDRDALGIYQWDEEVLTSPVNAAARYYNTFWHERQLWFNDLSENMLMFTIA